MSSAAVEHGAAMELPRLPRGACDDGAPAPSDEIENLRLEVERLAREKQELHDVVKCDQIQEDVLALANQALQPIFEDVASGAYDGRSAPFEEDLRRVFEDHVAMYNSRTEDFSTGPRASQRDDLLRSLVTSLWRITLMMEDSRLRTDVERRTEELLLEVSSGAAPAAQFWQRLRAAYQHAAEATIADAEALLQRLGCAPEHARPHEHLVHELHAVARSCAAGKMEGVQQLLPELLRRSFEEVFRYDPKTGTPRVTGPFTDLDAQWIEAMERVDGILEAFSVPLDVALPNPGESTPLTSSPPEPAEEPVVPLEMRTSEEFTRLTSDSAEPAEEPVAPCEMGASEGIREAAPLLDAFARDRLKRELRTHAGELFEAQKTKQMVLAAASDLPLWALALQSLLRRDHLLVPVSAFKAGIASAVARPVLKERKDRTIAYLKDTRTHVKTAYTLTGAGVGAVVGLPAALFTFGLSIPVCAVLGGSAGRSWAQAADDSPAAGGRAHESCA